MLERGRWGRNGNYHYRSLQRLGNAMRKISRCPHDGSSVHLPRFVTYRHPRLSRQYQIKFVRSGMHMDLLRLPGFEAIQADEQPLPHEEVGLARLLSVECGCCLNRLEIIGHSGPMGEEIWLP